MAIDVLRPAQGNNLSDTLSTSIGSGDTTIPVNTISIWSSGGGKVIIDRGLSNQEIIYCSGVSGSSLVVQAGGRGCEGTTAQGHNVGAAVESVPTAGDWNDVITTLKNLFKTADGNIDITKLGTATYVADTGAANAYVATLVPTLASYTAGTFVAFKAANTNTGASTLNVNGLGAKSINKGSGSTALVAGDIIANQIAMCRYDGNQFQLLNPGTSQTAATSTVTGLVPTPPNDSTKFLRGDATWAVPTSATDGWISSPDTLTYVSASSFKIAGVDRTATYTKGTKVKFTNNSTTFYGVVISSSFSTDTTVTLAANNDYSINNSAITAPSYSYAVNPQGYPGWFNYTPTWGGFSANPTGGNNRFRVDGNTCMVYRANGAAGTSNATTLTMSVPVAPLNSLQLMCVVGNNTSTPSTAGLVQLTASSTTATYGLNLSGTGGFTASGLKDVGSQMLVYEI